MVKRIEHEVDYYYDSHSMKEDLMGEVAIHAELVRYLVLVLQWLFREKVCAIYENLNFYQTNNPLEYPLAPDIAVIKNEPFRLLRSWRVGQTGPAPQVVFEIASTETWKADRDEKPAKYTTLGVQEYYLFDPNEPRVWKKPPGRLLGWRLSSGSGRLESLAPDQEGRLWSQELDSFLVPDGIYLRLYDATLTRHLTEAEAVAKEREVLARRAAALAEKLRLLGVDPDELEVK